MHSVDLFVQHYMSTIRLSQLVEYMYLLTIMFDVSAASVLVSCATAFLVYLFRGVRFATLFLCTMLAGAVIVLVLKNTFNVARPTGAVFDTFGQSFPSYHAAIATIFFVMLMFVFDTYFKKFGRIVFNAFCIVSIILVGASRLYLGVHWLSDVVGGIMLGCIISFISIRTFRWYTSRVGSHITR